MKKLFTIALIAASSASFAQGLVGPKLGLNINNFKNTKVPAGQNAEQYKTSLTPSMGVVFNAQIGDYFAIRPEILWVQRGVHTEDTLSDAFGNPYTVTYKQTLNYIEIPFNLVGRIPAGPGKVEFWAGPSVGYMFGGKYKTPSKNYKVEGADQPTTPDPNSIYVNYLNVSINMGVGYNWKGLIFQAGYNIGLSNIAAHPEDNNNTAANEARDKDVTKMSAVTFGVAYLFGGKDED